MRNKSCYGVRGIMGESEKAAPVPLGSLVVAVWGGAGCHCSRFWWRAGLLTVNEMARTLNEQNAGGGISLSGAKLT